MEEILASIRKIISDDGSEGPAASKPERVADVIDLTEVVEEGKAIAAKGISAAMAVAATKADAAPPTVRMMAPEAESAAVPEPPAAPKIAAITEPPMPAEKPEVERQAKARESLVSAAAAEASARAFGALSASLDAAHGPAGLPLGQGNRTLQDLVRELLKPMLRDWLEVNLPTVVDRLVQKEIRELVRRADD